MSLLQRIKQHLLPPSSRSFHAFETNANSEMHQLRLENASLMQQLAYMSDQLTQITEQVNQIQAEHTYEQQRDMMLFWAEYQKPSESPIAAKKRFFRSFPRQRAIFSFSKITKLNYSGNLIASAATTGLYIG